MAGAGMFLQVVIIAAAIIATAVLAFWLLIKGTQGAIWGLRAVGRFIAFMVKHVFTFVRNMITDSLRSVGALLTACVLIPLALLNLLFFRWETCKHYTRALEDEVIGFGLGIYRVCLGNPLHFIGMGMITDGFERRLPEVVARAPRTAKSSVRDGKFKGYKVTGVLPAGGSGARLFLAKPRGKKLEELLAAGHKDPGTVVIKAFSLSTGSTLPQIVRESRALESARKLGLVIEHELSEKSFHYVMPYVPGEGLDLTIAKMHEKCGEAGLSDRHLRVALGYVGDLLYTLDSFHSGGLWHKDIKPSNLIVSAGRAHLVDLGLVTPLASAMTLTTHGTEYFRDPEMVRQALRGVRVHEVNGVKFDIYSSGAVLYSLIENSFPAHGSLSRITRRCPEAITWIVRRAMADVEQRYGSVQEMLSDIRTVLAARDPFAVRPADLPSVSGRDGWKIPRTSFARNFGSGFAAHFGSSQQDAVPASQPGKSRRLHPVAHTGTAEKAVRRSTGRSLVASLIGIFFLVGLTGIGIMANDSNRPFFESHGISFDSNPVAWCLENESDEACVQAPVAPVHSAQVSAKTDSTNRGTKEAVQAAKQELTRLRRQWSRQLDNQLDELTKQFKGRAKTTGDAAKRDASSEGEKQVFGTILLLKDLAPTSPREIVNALDAELTARNFAVVGNPADGIGDESDILYEAGARAAIGIADQHDADALLRLELFLAEHKGLDAIIWITSDESRDSLSYQFVRPRSAEAPLGTFVFYGGAAAH